MGYDNELQNEREGQHHNEPPALRAGERWLADDKYVMRGKDQIGSFTTAELATTAVAEHNQHATLVEQRDRLLAALKKTAHNAADGSGLCWCVVDDRVFGHHQKCTSIRRVLNEVEPAITPPATSERE